MKGIIEASKDDISMCAGFGPQKVCLVEKKELRF